MPLSLNPDGAFAVGVKGGRRSVDVLRVDFTDAVRRRWALDYRYPAPGPVLQQIGARLAEIRALLSPAEYARVQGVGIAVPFNLGGWQTLLEMPPEVAAQWPVIDLRVEVAALTDLPVALLKDTAAACVAELVAGRGSARGNAAGLAAPPQLLSVASLLNLELLYEAAGLDVTAVADARALRACALAGPHRRLAGGCGGGGVGRQQRGLPA